MATTSLAARAYASTTAHRNLRMQEADVFHRVNAALRLARDGTPLDRVRALADNDLLWSTVGACASDPDNRLPQMLRANLVSIGHAVRREMQGNAPDLAFLLQVNENVAAGLMGT